MTRLLVLLLLLPSLAAASAKQITPGAAVTAGSLRVTRGDATFELPLLHSDVDAEISGLVANVTLTQTFGNPFDEPIEAVYLFPLPDESAVHAMTMKLGERTIVGRIETRQEARRIYDEARDNGQAAALLDQERPNVFTQHVANILPGEAIEVRIEFADVLQYEDGGYEWAMPLVVGPRFVPAEGTGEGPGDAEALDAPYSAGPTGNAVDIGVVIDAGVPVHAVRSDSHRIVVDEHDDSWIELHVDPADDVPNKDFVLRYEVAGDRPEVALLAHRDGGDGYFVLMVQPPADDAIDAATVTPKDLVFVVDTSCSQSGAPMAASKDAMRLAIAGMNPEDRFEILKFSSGSTTLGGGMLDNTAANRARGLAFVDSFAGAGGTKMLPAVEAALDAPLEDGRLRTVLMMTDGYVGNDKAIIGAVQERLGSSRFFTLGSGSSTNRFLIDRLSRVGRGDAVYLRPDADPEPLVQQFFDRINNPLITGLEIQTDGIELLDVTPDPLPDLFGGQPIILVGRYDTPGVGTVTLSGQVRGEPWEQRLQVELPAVAPEHESLSKLWARGRIEELELDANWEPERFPGDAYEEAVTDLALQFGLMSPYTSFVAVDERVVTEGGKPKTVRVPLETPEFVDHGAIFGEDEDAFEASAGLFHKRMQTFAPPAARRSTNGALGASGYGRGGGGLGGIATRGPVVMAPSPTPAADPDPEASVVVGALDSSDFQNRLRRHLPRIQRCYEEALKVDPAVAGKLELELVLNPDGTVDSVTAEEDTVGNTGMTACVRKVVAGIRFSGAGATTTVRYPFVFRVAD